jgi:hypothetical protein
MVGNFSDEKITLPKATVLGISQEISESLDASINVSRVRGPSREPETVVKQDRGTQWEIYEVFER